MEVVICLICADFQKGKLNIREAKRNLTEMVLGAKKPEEIKHLIELKEKLEDIEDESDTK